MKQIAIIAGAVFAYSAFSIFTGSLCLFQSIIGLPCPACGTMRAAWHLLNGEFMAALAHHPLIFVTIILCGVYLSRYALFLFRKFSAKSAGEPLAVWGISIGKKETALLFAVSTVYILVFVIRLALFFPHTEPLVPNDAAVFRRLLNFLQ